MRNDLKDDPIDIPSLTIDKDDPLEEGYFDAHSNKTKTPASSGSKKFWGYTLLFLFILYSAGMVGLFWIGKRAADSVQHQLDEKTTSTSILTQTTSGQLQKITEQFTSQQEATKTALENVRAQNKQLASRLQELSAMQQKVVIKQEATDKQFSQLQDKLAELAKSTTAGDRTKQIDQLANEVATLKKTQLSEETINSLTTDIQVLKKQNLPQTIKSMQDDLLLLRSQLDTSANQATNNQSIQALQSKVNQQLQDFQHTLQTMQKQLDSRSPY